MSSQTVNHQFKIHHRHTSPTLNSNTFPSDSMEEQKTRLGTVQLEQAEVKKEHKKGSSQNKFTWKKNHLRIE